MGLCLTVIVLVCACMCVCVRVCVCVCVRMYACVRVCMCVCVYVCMYVYWCTMARDLHRCSLFLVQKDRKNKQDLVAWVFDGEIVSEVCFVNAMCDASISAV